MFAKHTQMIIERASDSRGKKGGVQRQRGGGDEMSGSTSMRVHMQIHARTSVRLSPGTFISATSSYRLSPHRL